MADLTKDSEFGTDLTPTGEVVIATPLDTPVVINNPIFSISSWFNERPIRAVGTIERPYFYAADVGSVLGIASIRSSIRNFDDTEIVTPAVRQQEKLITYRKVGDKWRLDQRVTLLTEYGVYRLVLNSRSEHALPFKRHIYNLIHQARMHEKEQINILHQMKYDELTRTFDGVVRKLAAYEKNSPAVYVFERKMSEKDNPFLHMVPRERDTYREPSKQVANIGNGPKKLIKFTIKPSSDDYTMFDLHSIIYGPSEHIMEYFIAECLSVSERALAYCRYFEDEDPDNIIDNVVNECSGVHIVRQ